MLKVIKSFNNYKGMTLIEVMAALVLLALLSTTVVAIFVPSSMWIQQARNQTTASNYARAVLDRLRSDPTKVIEGNINADTLSADNAYKPAGMTAQVEIKNEPGFSTLFAARVTVNWTEGSKARYLNMATLVRGN